ncbi:methionyl-tRNA synthetase [Methanohalophilus levihalophilus]|uniref:methionine--tRNA ligase n=1 Tax=Methanohalophilus levihalophilus TaxID=1431282 RepID=UPI001AE1408A|nr:methionine--tRNA ligase [Methanohalophilus levihalophilus]MBP2030024.1 methionyl-tRNA synthetase [Methanohalophilus levihalophilus]
MSQFPSDKPVLVTCGLPYANGMAHVGHLRTYIPADIFVRSLKKMGQEVTFVCGSDTHGTPIVFNAEELNTTPKELIKIYHKHFDETFKKVGVKFDAFGTTDDPTNHNRTTDIVNKLIENGYVFPKTIEIAYCSSCDRFLPDRYVKGVCPHCKKEARGDECDQGCGKHLEPGELESPTCTTCGGPAEYRKQEHFFFKLSEFKDFLIEHLEKLGGTTNARNYALGWIKQELTDWCITRNLEWGVKFPGHDDLVVYVWVDAPIGYIAFTEEWAEANNESWEKFWKDDGRIVHFIGGDIIYHHCIFWPAMLKGAGYSQPWAVVASGMVKIEDKTFSKSRGYVVWVGEDYLDHGFHPDLLRYYLASYTSHTKELNFSWKVFQDKINTELVGVFGNFLYRTLLFTFKNFKEIPEGEIKKETLDEIAKTIESTNEAMENYEFKKYADTAMALASYGNTYFQSNEPWKLVKEDKDACGEVIANCIQIAKALCLLFEPILPEKMEDAWEQIGMETDVHTAGYAEGLVPVVSGTALAKPSILFEKIEDEKTEEMEAIATGRVKAAMEKESGTGKKKEIKEMKELITFDDFSKLDLRVGTIVNAEKIKKSKKLLRLEVDLGEENLRQVVAGIALTHDPEDVKGKQVIVLVNLEPAKLCGVESHGMVLAGVDDEGNAILLQPEKEADAGTNIG